MYRLKNNEVPKNKILALLPESDYQRLASYLEPVFLSFGQILYQPREVMRYIYFPTCSMVSLITFLKDSSMTEFALVGNEGVVGIHVFLGGHSTTSHGIVQIEGSALRMDADLVKEEFVRGGVLQKSLLLYTQALLTQIAQNSVCKTHHKIENRLARWLLSVQDCVQKDELLLTQKYIADLLGTRRATVTVAAGNLQDQAMIRYSRGRITILNRKVLKATTCECYELINAEVERLVNKSQLTKDQCY